jgi:hypothetical protein
LPGAWPLLSISTPTADLWNAFAAEAIAVIRASNPNRTLLAGPADWNRALHNVLIPSGHWRTSDGFLCDRNPAPKQSPLPCLLEAEQGASDSTCAR